MIHRKYLWDSSTVKSVLGAIRRPHIYSLFLCVSSLSTVLLTGCETVVNSPSSMMTASQSPPNPIASALARTGLAASFIQSGDLDAAQRTLAKALESDPKSPEANNMMGVLLQRAGGDSNQVKAEEYFKKSISYKSDFAQAHNNYGVFLSTQKRYQEAYAQFEIAGNQLGYADRASALENLGRTALVLGKKAEAQDAFIRALEINNNSQIARFELSELMLQQDRIQTSRKLYDEYLKLAGDQPQSARSLWLGMRIAQKTQDSGRLQFLSSRLEMEFPDSPECQHYHDLLKSGAIWN
jgi:type IV pilus assembly protein PilF